MWKGIVLIVLLASACAAPTRFGKVNGKSSKELYAARVRALTARAAQESHHLKGRPVWQPANHYHAQPQRPQQQHKPYVKLSQVRASATQAGNSTGGSTRMHTTTREQMIGNLLAATEVLAEDFLGVRRLVMPNGVTLLHLRETSAPTVSVVFSYHAGSRQEGESNQGVAHLLEHMMFKGTHTRQVQWGRLFYVLGDQTNAFTTFGNTAYFHTVHKSALEPILELELDRMKNLTLDEEQFRKEKNVVMSELTMSRNDALTRLDEEVMKAAYPNDWPGRSIGGNTVMDLTRDDAMLFYAQAYRPGCLTVAVVGDIEWEPLVRRIEAAGLVTLGTGNVHEFAKCTFDIPKPVPVTETAGFDATVSMDNKVIMKEESADMSVLEYIVPLCNMSNIKDVAALRVVEVLLNTVMTDLLNSVGVPAADSGAMSDFEEDAGWMRVAVAMEGGDKFTQLVQADDALSGVGGLFDMFAAQGDNALANPLDASVVASVVAMVVESVRRDWFSDVGNLAVHLAVDQTLTGDHVYTQRLLNATKYVTVSEVTRVMLQYFQKSKLVVGTYSGGTEAEAQQTVDKYGPIAVYTEHESVQNSAEYFKSLECNIVPAATVLSQVAELRYTDEFTPVEADAPPVGQSVPIVPPLCFEDECDNAKSYRPARPIYLKLTNGMELLAHEDTTFGSSDETLIMGHIDGGMEYDPAGYEGVSLMLSLLMQLNVEMYLQATIMGEMNNMTEGATISSVPQIVVAPQMEGMLINGETDCGGIDMALEAIHHMLTNSVPLTPEEHQTMQGVVGEMVEAAKNDQSYIVRQLILDEIYPPEHPMLRSPTADSISGIPLELVTKFYVNRICPENVRLSVVSGRYGASPVAAINKMADLFEKWPSCDSPMRRPVGGEAVGDNMPKSTSDILTNGQATADQLNPTKPTTLLSMANGQTSGMRAIKDLFESSPAEKAVYNFAKDALSHARGGGTVLSGAVKKLSPLPTSLASRGLVSALEFDEGAVPAAAAPASAPAPPPPALDLAEVPSASKRMTADELKAKLVQVMTQGKLRSEVDKLVAGGSEFLDHIFGDDNDEDDDSKPKGQLLGGLEAPQAGDGGFGFLNQLQEFRNTLNKQMAKGAGRDGAKRKGGIQAKVRAEVPKFMRNLKFRSHGSQHQGSNHAQEQIPGLSNRARGLVGLGELGSLLALSWADVTNAVHTGTAPETEKSTAVLGGALKRLKAKMAPPAVQPQSVQDKMSAGLSKQMEGMRGTVERLAERLPPSARDVFKDAHLPRLTHGISFSQFNDQLRESLTQLEAKLPDADHVGPAFEADMTNIAMQLEAVKPQLSKIGHLPLRLLADDAPTPVSYQSTGSNSAPEPTTGGAMGLVSLPPIPSQPYYPEPKSRNGVVWLKIHVPGMHEVQTTMLSDSIVHSSPHLIPAVIGNHILGGNSLAGKLGYWVRDCKGLTYHISSSLEVSRRSGLLEISLQTQDGAALDQAVNDTLNILEDVQKQGFTNAELSAAKRNLQSLATLRAATSGLDVCESIMMDTVYSKDTHQGEADNNMWTSRSLQIMGTNMMDLNKAAAGVFNPMRIVIVSMGNTLEDTRLPAANATMEAVYQPAPEDPPVGTDRSTGEDGGCADVPEEEAGNPYRVGDVATYTPPSATAVRAKAQMRLAQKPSYQQAKPDISQSSQRSTASPFVDTPIMAQSDAGASGDAAADTENQEIRLRQNLFALEKVGEKYVDAASGGALSRTNNVFSLGKDISKRAFSDAAKTAAKTIQNPMSLAKAVPELWNAMPNLPDLIPVDVGQ